MKKDLLSIVAVLLFIFISETLTAQYSVSLGIDQPSELTVSELADLTYTGDPVQLGSVDMVQGGSGQYIYHWDPEEGLDDPNVARPLASPESDVSYSLTISDGNGCSVMTSQNITVDISGINKYYTKPSIKVYPVPAKNIVYLSIESPLVLNDVSLVIYDIAGHMVIDQKIQSNDMEIGFPVNVNRLDPGSYLMVVSSPDFLSNHNIILY